MMNSGIVDGFDKFRLIRSFYDELRGPFVTLPVADFERKDLVSRLDQLAELNPTDDFKSDVAAIQSHVKDITLRRYREDEYVAKFNVNYVLPSESTTSWYLTARFDSSWRLISYTVEDAEPTPFEFSATICAGGPDVAKDSDYAETTRWEDVVDFCWSMQYNQGVYLSATNDAPHNAYISVWTLGVEPHAEFAMEWAVNFQDGWWAERKTKSRDEVVAFVKAYMKNGLPAAQSLFDWCAVKSSHCRKADQESLIGA